MYYNTMHCQKLTLVEVSIIFFLFSGNRYVVILTDYLTKWVEVEGIPDKSAKSVMSVFIKFVCAQVYQISLLPTKAESFVTK